MTPHLLIWLFEHRLIQGIFTDKRSLLDIGFGSILLMWPWLSGCVICLKRPFFPNTSSLYSLWSQKVGNIIQPLEQQQSVCGFQASSNIFHFYPRVLFYRYLDLCMSGCVCGGSCLCRFTNRLLHFLQCCGSVLLACKLACDQLLLQNYKVRGNAYQQLHTSLT